MINIPNISMIACCDLNRLIGYENKLPFKNEEDMEFFKYKTANSTVIMGYNTFQSIGKGLKGRNNIVLTSKYRKNTITTNHNDVKFVEYDCSFLKEILRESFIVANSKDLKNKIFIIGGAIVYKECLEFSVPKTVYLNIINGMCLPKISDTLLESKNKSTYMPAIPLRYRCVYDGLLKDSKNLYQSIFRYRNEEEYYKSMNNWAEMFEGEGLIS